MISSLVVSTEVHLALERAQCLLKHPAWMVLIARWVFFPELSLILSPWNTPYPPH